MIHRCWTMGAGGVLDAECFLPRGEAVKVPVGNINPYTPREVVRRVDNERSRRNRKAQNGSGMCPNGCGEMRHGQCPMCEPEVGDVT
jgi:hypothetical protein